MDRQTIIDEDHRNLEGQQEVLGRGLDEFGLEKKILDKNKIYYELIKNEENLVKVDNTVKSDVVQWMKKLFESWDDDGSGVLEIDEICEPLITLGLAPDKKFVAQLIKSIDPKFLNKDDEDLSITFKDFLKIFRTDRLKKDFILKPDKKPSSTPNDDSSTLTIHFNL